MVHTGLGHKTHGEVGWDWEERGTEPPRDLVNGEAGELAPGLPERGLGDHEWQAAESGGSEGGVGCL